MGADEYGNEEEGHDMAVTAVTWTPNPMSFPVPATFTVTVKNNGSVTEDAARVKVFVNGVQVGETEEVELAAGDSTTVDFPWTPNVIGTVEIVGRTEPTSGTTDTNESNNSLTRETIVHGHDIKVTRIGSFPENPTPGLAAKLYVWAKNVGTDNETGVRVKAIIDGVQVGATYTTPLRVGQEVRVAFNWTPAADGNYTFDGRAEPTVGPDFNRADNLMRMKLAAWRRNVAILDFYLRPGLPHVGQPARMGIVIKNKTDFRESGALVTFYVRGVMIGSRRVELLPQQTKTVEVPWTFTVAGGVFVEGRVEPTSGSDKDRSDNYRRSYLVIRP